jgi:hypothetical protein
MLQAMNTGHDGRLAAETRVHFTSGTRRVGEYVDGLMAAHPERIERRDQHGTPVEYTLLPREERADAATCITVDGTAEATPVVYALRSHYTGTMLRFRTASGLEHTVSPEHPLYRLRDAVEYTPASEVRVGDWLAAPRHLIADDNTSVSSTDAEDSYWAGMLTGDGSISGHAGTATAIAERPVALAVREADPPRLRRIELVPANSNVDVIPCTTRLAAKLAQAKALGSSQRQIATAAGCSQALISAYQRGTRLPTPGRLEQLCLALQDLGVVCDDLLLLARADLRWERVMAIEPVAYDGPVYDLQVSEQRHSGQFPHNFAADCLLTSNSMTTLHSNSPRDTISRLETMVLMAGMDLPLRAIREQIASAVQLIVHQSRMKDGSRKIVNISEVQGMEGDVITMQDIFIFEQTGVENGRVVGRLRPTGIRPRFIEAFELANIHLPPQVFGYGASGNKW